MRKNFLWLAIFCFAIGVIALGLIFFGCARGVPQVVVHDHRTVIEAPAPEREAAPRDEGPRIHGTPTWENPRVRVFQNMTGEYSRPTTFLVRINGGEPIVVPPGRASADQYLEFGQNRLEIQGYWEDPLKEKIYLPAVLLPELVRRTDSGARVIQLQ